MHSVGEDLDPPSMFLDFTGQNKSFHFPAVLAAQQTYLGGGGMTPPYKGYGKSGKPAGGLLPCKMLKLLAVFLVRRLR